MYRGRTGMFACGCPHASVDRAVDIRRRHGRPARAKGLTRSMESLPRLSSAFAASREPLGQPRPKIRNRFCRKNHKQAQKWRHQDRFPFCVFFRFLRPPPSAAPRGIRSIPCARAKDPCSRRDAGKAERFRSRSSSRPSRLRVRPSDNHAPRSETGFAARITNKRKKGGPKTVSLFCVFFRFLRPPLSAATRFKPETSQPTAARSVVKATGFVITKPAPASRKARLRSPSSDAVIPNIRVASRSPSRPRFRTRSSTIGPRPSGRCPSETTTSKHGPEMASTAERRQSAVSTRNPNPSSTRRTYSRAHGSSSTTKARGMRVGCPSAQKPLEAPATGAPPDDGGWVFMTQRLHDHPGPSSNGNSTLRTTPPPSPCCADTCPPCTRAISDASTNPSPALPPCRGAMRSRK